MLGSPENSNCTVIVASSFEVEEEQYLLHCHPGGDEWIKLVSPFNDVSFQDIIINYNKKIYVSASNFNLIVLDAVDGEIRLQLMGTIDSKDIGAQGCGRSRFVESSGDLFYLWIEELGCFGNDGPLTNIAVYCLDFEAMSWRRVESIGSDRSFLLSGLYGFSFPSMEGMLHGNCVYLVWSCCDSERLFKFCLDDMTISFCQILSQPTKPWCRAFWSVPPSIQSISVVDESTLPNNLPSTELSKINQPDGLDMHIEDGRQGNSLMPWDDLPLELIELIASNLSLVDRIRFSAVCKEFSKVSIPIEQAKIWPWLMHMSKQDGTCKLFDPLRCEEYSIQVTPFDTDEERHIFRSSKDGWVFVSAGDDDDDIFVINPFTEDIVEPAMFERSYYFNGVSFSSNPMCSDCVFFGIVSSENGNFLSVHTWRHGGDDWIEQFLEYDVPFPVGYSNPVMFCGEFYCLGRKGNLGVFDPTSDTWRILDKPESIHAEMDLLRDDHRGREFCYLVDMEGELVSLFLRNAASPPRVFKLDKTNMSWVEVDDLGGGALFLDFRSSYGVASPDGGQGNRIYFPRYSDDRKPAFYDMETKMYCPLLYDLKEPLNCVWVVPNLHKNISAYEDA
ncbi:hypothetical protein ABZP36_030611 [Zizania latifolia]